MFLEALILGVLQGATEFLPVSSSGHLVIAQAWLKFAESGLFFDISVHVGTLFSILVYYRRHWLPSQQKSFMTAEFSNKFWLLIIASVPTAAIGLGFRRQLEALFQSIESVALGFTATGIILYLGKILASRSKNVSPTTHLDSWSDIKWWQALLIGTVQGLAIIPGISRAGSTIVFGTILGIHPIKSASFSFLLSVPAIVGAMAIQLTTTPIEFNQQITAAAIGLFSAAAIGYLVIPLVETLAASQRLYYFAFYLWALAAVVFAVH